MGRVGREGLPEVWVVAVAMVVSVVDSVVVGSIRLRARAAVEAAATAAAARVVVVMGADSPTDSRAYRPLEAHDRGGPDLD